MESLTKNRHLTAKAREIGEDRARILKAARPLLKTLNLTRTAKAIGTSPGNLSKLRDRFAHLQDHELTPENLAADFVECGRESDWEEVAQKPEVRQRLKQLYLHTTGASSEYMTVGRRTGSLAMTLEVFGLDALCPENLRSELLAGKQPKPLERIVREITTEVEQRFRGAKHMALHGTFRNSREMVETMEDGTKIEIKPGDWWVFDDMSANVPHWFIGPDGEPLVGRQGLYAFDICRKWLGVEKVGTVRDSYTAAIILRFIRRLMQTFGKPRRGIVFEQSVWKARCIAGFRITSSGDVIEEEFDRPAMDEYEQARLQDGLEALGLRIHYTTTPRGKEIESGFRYQQKVTSVFAFRASVERNQQIINIGMHRGELEAGAKAMRRAHAKSHKPGDLGFLSIAESADLEVAVMEYIDNRKVRRAESAQAAFDRSMAECPPSKLSEHDYAVFLPHLHELEIRGGKVIPTVDGDPYEFSFPELFASLGAGYRVYVRFDPSEPTLGAAIYNREDSSANHQGWQMGQFMGWADYVPLVSRFDWSNTSQDNPANQIKRRFNKFVRTEFRAVGMPHAKAATARNGQGNVAVVTSSREAELQQRTDGNAAAAETGEMPRRIHNPEKTRARELEDLADAALASVKE